MRFGSVCSGIEAASVAWEPIGWKAAWFAEIEPFPCAVLKHHYPDTPNRGDMNLWKEWPDAAIDVLCGGTPCQSFSVAGLRKGLDDPRGNLMLVFLAIAKRHRPRWLVWENVPGVLSSNGGRDFGSFLGGLAECGYGFAYRVLDAQYFGLAQRRKRVFVVAHLGDWRPAAAVLFERESLCGHPAPRREAGQGPAPSVTAGAPNGGPGHGARSGSAKEGLIVPVAFGGNRTSGSIDVSPALLAQPGSGWKGDFESETFVTTHTLRGEGFDASEDGTGRGTPLVPVMSNDPATAICANEQRTYTNEGNRFQLRNVVAQPAIAWDEELNASVEQAGTLLRGGDGGRHDGVLAPTLTATNDPSRSPQSSEITAQVAAVTAAAMQVRRLTPVECERLQGFPDGYTAIPWRGKQADQCPDGPRYKALGNSWAVPVVRWIGERINLVDSVLQQQEVAA